MPALLRHPLARLALLLLVALALRWDTFGDPNMHGDEVFYQTVGVAMHHGALPYVDVWDRKPFGLFALSWLVAFLSEDMLAFQIAAALCAAGTAACIAAMAREWAGSKGAVLAGIAYLLALAPMQGYGAQSPVFYNLFIAAAALLVLRALPALRSGTVPRAAHAAMLLAGIGITIKTSALFEAAFLGLFASVVLARSGTGLPRTLRIAALWAALGAAPTLAIAASYGALGHWSEYWHAMVGANLAKEVHWPSSLRRAGTMALVLSPLLLFTALGFVRFKGEARVFVAGWIVAAVIGLFAVPNFYLHYGLPILVPLCLASAGLFAQGALGTGALALLAFLSFTAAPMKPGHAEKSAAAIDRLEDLVRGHIGDGPLLLYDAPPQLYMRTGQPFSTPLVFPTHLAHELERDVSHLSTLAETQRALARRPGAVVMAHPLRNRPYNAETHELVLAYVGANCRLIEVVPTLERQRTDRIAVWGDCRH